MESQTAHQQRETSGSTMQSSSHEQGLVSYMGVPGTETKLTAMDDLQLMDALLLDNDGVPFEEAPGSLDMMNNYGHANNGFVSSNAGSMPQQLAQYHQQSETETSLTDQTLAMNQHLQQAFAKHSAAAAAAIMPSPLTVRLNYPFGNMSDQHHQHSFGPGPVVTGVQGKGKRSSATPSETSSSKRARRMAPPVSEDEHDEVKRRMDRNMREQQRSHKITDQIANLKELLAGANIHFKPDKYSTLISVVDYIKQLQERSQLLDAEHKKLLDTISKTNEMVNSPYYPASFGAESSSLPNDLLSDAPSGAALEDEDAVFVKGLDYCNVFKQCSIALAIASIDGRFIACNAEFEALTGYDREELLPSACDQECQPMADSVPSDALPTTVTTSPNRNLSLFNLLSRDDMENVFMAMSHMLKQPIVPKLKHIISPESDFTISDDGTSHQPDFWSGDVSQSRRPDSKIRINVTLVRSPQGRPKFFQCALTPAGLEDSSSSQSISSDSTSLKGMCV